MGEVYMEVPMERFIEYKRAEEDNARLRKALEIILEEEASYCDGHETLIHATARRALEGQYER